MHTIAGLLHADHRYPSLDYEMVLKATLSLTQNVRQVEKQFRAAVFNVLSHNRDDHAKNFAYLMDENGNWLVSPSYDLTFSTGPSGEHATMIMGEGKKPTLTHLLKLASISGLRKNTACTIIDEVQAAIAKWKQFALAANVSQTSEKMIQNALNQINKNLF